MPDTLGRITALESLTIENCFNINTLPASIEQMDKSEMSKEVAALIQCGVGRLDLHNEAETLMLGFGLSRSAHPSLRYEACPSGER